MENDDKRTKCSNVSKHKLLECVLEDVRVKWCQFCVFLGPVISRLSHCIAALFFTWGICIDGSLTITLLNTLPPSGDDDPMYKDSGGGSSSH